MSPYYYIIKNVITQESNKIVSLGGMPVEIYPKEEYYKELNLQFEDSWILEKDFIQNAFTFFEEDYHETMKLQLFVIQLLKDHDYPIQEDTFTLVDISDYSQKYESDIQKYIEPIKKVFSWITDQHIQMISEIWATLVERHQMKLYNYLKSNNHFRSLIKSLIHFSISTESEQFYKKWSKFHVKWSMDDIMDNFYGIMKELFLYFASYGTNYAAICLFLYENHILAKKKSVSKNYQFLRECICRIKSEIKVACVFENHDLNMCMLAVYKSILNTCYAPIYLKEEKDIDFDSKVIKGIIKNMSGSSLFSEMKIHWCLHQFHYIFRNGHSEWLRTVDLSKPTFFDLVFESAKITFLSLGIYNKENLKSLPYWIIEYC